MSNNPALTLPLEEPKRPTKPPRVPKTDNPKEAARIALGRWLDAPTNLTHWDKLIAALIRVELHARVLEIVERQIDAE